MDGVQGLPQLSHANINQRVYEILRERILSKHFAPGQRLNVRAISAQLGVSRTPLKDALNRLAAEGLVEIRPRSGTYVTAPSLTDIEQLLDVRRLLEVYAVELAIRRVGEPELAQIRDLVAQLRELVQHDDWRSIYQRHVELDYQLHRLIVCWSGNEQLQKVWEEVNVHVQISRMRYRQASSQLDLAQEEHERILGAFEVRDVAAARQAIDQHIERTKHLLRQDFESVVEGSP